MIKPSLDDLITKVDSKYSLVILAARRGRAIQDGSPVQVESKSNKPVTIALEEVAADKLYFERTQVSTRINGA